jgi:adenylate cyclase
VKRKLTAILCADVYGYSRLMGEDEEATLRTLSGHRNIIDGLIDRHHGRFVNSAGDSVVAEFASVVEAVNCAVEIQNVLRAENANSPPERRMEFRIGVNSGDVMVEGEQIYGDGVNVAARLENLADPGGICISGTVYEQVRDRLALSYENRGEQTVKNIARPVHVWRIVLDGTPAVSHSGRRYLRGGVLSLTGLAIAIGTFVLVQHLSLKPPHTSASIPPPAKPALTLPSIPSIAVLPFTNLSGDPQQEYFSDGISGQLINELSRLPGLFVIARNSSFAYKGKAIGENKVGKELGVRYVLEGRVQKSPDRVRIGVELVDASTSSEMWTQEFDRPLKDIFRVQDEIVGKVVTTLGLIFKGEEMNFPHEAKLARPDNLEAFDDILHAGQYFYRFTREDAVKARGWAEKAIAADPNYAEAYATVSATYLNAVLFRWSDNPASDLERSYELTRKALALDDSNAVALAQLSTNDWLQRRFDKAVAEAERCVALNPNQPICYEALWESLDVSNRLEEAGGAAEKAMRLDPSRQDFYAYFIGQTYVDMGHYQEAIPLLKRHLAVFPDQPWAHVALIEAYSELGRDQEARAEAAELKRINPQFAYKHINKDAARNARYEHDLRKAGLQ